MFKELCYLNNPESLFRKYAHLVTWLARTNVGRAYLGVPKDIALMLPNGFLRSDGDKYGEGTFYTQAVYSPKLYPALAKLDAVQQWLRDFREARDLLAWELGITREMPGIARATMLATGGPYYPDAHAETTTVDGYAGRDAVNEAWAAIHDGAGNASDDTTAEQAFVFILNATTTSNQWGYIRRAFFLFDTSALPDSAIVSAGTFSFYVTGRNDNLSQSAALIDTTPASNTAIANADYANTGTTEQATALDITTMSDAAYNDWTLNAAGKASIALTGITKFGLRGSSDRADTAPSWVSNVSGGINGYMADQGSNQPKLVVTYSLPSGGAFLFNMV